MFIIWIDSVKKLLIIDNCFGVKNEDLDRILKLNIPSKRENSRNEYGMGIKTAGFWLGEQITILTKHMNNEETLRIHLDLKDLESVEKNNNKVPIEYLNKNKFKEVNNFDFGTMIEINNINNQRFTIKKLNTISNILASRYREDIRLDKLKLKVVMLDQKGIWNDCFLENQIEDISKAKSLEFKPPILKKDSNNKEIKINIRRSFNFNGNNYDVNGWVGVLEKGSRKQPGLTLFRRGRAIKGDDENNYYKPKEIFGDSGSYEFQRVTGWLHLDNFPVTQQKNDFAWSGGLEDEFIRIIKEEIESNDKYNIRKIARTSKNKESEIKSSEVINKNVVKDLKESMSEDNFFNSVDVELSFDDYDDLIRFTLIEDKIKYVLNLKINNDNRKNLKWLSIENIDNDKKIYNLTLNFSLPWFSPFNNDLENVKDQIVKFAVYFAFAEIKHTESLCYHSYEMREILNKCFSQKIDFKKEK